MFIRSDRERVGTRLYGALSSTRLTIFLLMILVLAMVLGTIFPQGGDDQAYLKAFGTTKYTWFYTLGLFDIFHSWWFLLLSSLLFLNLALCSIRGMQIEARLRSKIVLHERHPSLRDIRVPQEGRTDLAALLKKRRYRIRSVERGESQVFICQRGLPARPWSIIYHAALALAFLGFVFTALTSFDGEVYLKPGESKSIPLSGEKMGIHQLFRGKLSPFRADRVDSIRVELKSFDTEYTWYNEKYFTKDWKSTLSASKDGDVGVRKEIEVNDPLRYSGLTVYQWDYRQFFDLALPETVATLEARKDFEIPGLEGKFRTGTVYLGTLFKGGEREPIVPNADLYMVSSEGKREKIGKLSLGTPFVYEGVLMELRGVKEESGLYYRRDDGIRLLYPAFLIFMLGLFLRVFWPSYRLSILYQPPEKRVSIWGKASGIAAYLDEEISLIERAVSASPRLNGGWGESPPAGENTHTPP